MPKRGQNREILRVRDMAKAYDVPEYTVLIVDAAFLRHVGGQASIFSRKIWIKASGLILTLGIM